MQASWLDATHKAHLREIADRTLRYVEDLDAARERAAVTQDELNNQMSDQMNRTMYLVSADDRRRRAAAAEPDHRAVRDQCRRHAGGREHLCLHPPVVGLIAIAVVAVILLHRLKWI